MGGGTRCGACARSAPPVRACRCRAHAWLGASVSLVVQRANMHGAWPPFAPADAARALSSALTARGHSPRTHGSARTVGRSPYALLRLLQCCIGTAESALSGCAASMRVRAARCTLCCSLLLSALTAVRAANIPQMPHRPYRPLVQSSSRSTSASRGRCSSPTARRRGRRRRDGRLVRAGADPIRSLPVGRNLRNFRNFGIAGGSAMGRT